MAFIGALVGKVNGWLYDYILIALLLFTGFYFTFRTRFVQLRLFKESIKVVTEKPKEEGQVSSFQALMVSTASRVGTGNIVGVSSAICLGGYGAIFWMWVIAIIGGATALIESTLAQIYKRRDKNGSCYGGPAYYIETALHSRGLAVLFAFCLILTYAGGFNMLASFNLQSTFSVYSFYDPKVTPWIIGAILASIVLWCILGGGKRIIRTTSTVVPVMGILYVAVSLIVIIAHFNLIPSVFANIFKEAFNFKAIFGGFGGSCLMFGIKRGLYSNEAGVGSAPNAAAAAHVSHPVKQGLVQMLSVFIDTLLICTATALMCLCSGIAPAAELAGAPYVQASISTVFGSFGNVFVTIAMVLFAFTTLLGNLYYCDNCITFINKAEPSKRFMVIYRIISAVVIFIGAGLSMGFAWNFSDLMMAVMCLINLPCCFVLGKAALNACKDYEKQRKEGRDPHFVAKNIGLDDENLTYWKE